MKLIDQTPLQNENGEIGILQRVQGTLKYGLSWYPELEAQKFALGLLERGLGKGYTIIRNTALGASGIVIPLAIVGPAGIFAVYVTHLRGQYQAKGDSWGTLSGQSFKPASVNLLTRTERMSRALQAFIERQGVNAQSYVAREIVKLGGQPQLREGFTTDNGNIILDVHNMTILNPAELERQLNQITGVVTNGLFAIRPADVLLVANNSGVSNRSALK